MTHEEAQQLEAGPDLDAFVARTLNLPLSPYSRDIGAAWQVLERVDWPNVVVRRIFELGAPALVWLCSDDEDEWGTVFARAPTPALAICRAALLHTINEREEDRAQ
jgi:uncharacterized protein YbjT (DUF2867 family)